MRWGPEDSTAIPTQQVVNICDVIAHAELSVTFVHDDRVVVVLDTMVDCLVTVDLVPRPTIRISFI